MLSNQSLKIVLFAIFSISGFSGLIYESIWTHYLKLVLGHAAHSQTLVLILFMGGMAIGAWLVSRRSSLIKNPVLAYAIIELVIGVMGLLFHQIFIASQTILYDSVLPLATSPETAAMIRWSWAALMILPQSIMLGATFPLMSAGIVRLFPNQTGSILSMLYFTNSMGAAIGVLVSGFVLIDLVGLPGTILTAGLMNIALALLVWATVKNKPFAVEKEISEPDPRFVLSTHTSLILLAAFLTGLASFFYEIGWIRMLNQVFGTTSQSFELMLSAFIAGLAFGGLWIRRRIDKITNVLRFAGHVQIIMAFFAVLTLVLYNSTFDFMAMMMQALQRNEPGYRIFITSSHLIAFFIMTPAAFMAGMTLPLFTYSYMKRGAGENGIGKIYAANTIGSIVGIILAVHLVMPLLGLKNLIVLGGLVDLALGGILLYFARSQKTRLKLNPIIITLAGLTLFISMTAEFDRGKMTSGVFRTGTLEEKAENIIFSKDGKTATIAVHESFNNDLHAKSVSILTNGKPDAAVIFDDKLYSQDEPTMLLLGSYPLAAHPNARTAAVIGMGSGITSHTLLQTDRLESVDTIEIESAMVEGARHFDKFSKKVFTDPRSHIHIDDAKSFFSVNNKSYDLIVSEPSNPWVSGVASLYTEEFYSHIKRHLNEGGILAQWLQIYEIDLNLVATVIKAINDKFKYYAVYQTVRTDLVILASDDPSVLEFDPWIFSQPELAGSLKRVNITNLSDLYARRLGTKNSLEHLFLNTFVSIPTNSDFFPVLGRKAPKTRFLRKDALDLTTLPYGILPVMDFIDPAPKGTSRFELTPASSFRPARIQQAMYAMHNQIVKGTPDEETEAESRLPNQPVQKAAGTQISWIDDFIERCRIPHDIEAKLLLLATRINVHLPAKPAGEIWERIQQNVCFPTLPESTRNWIRLYHAVGERNPSAILLALNQIPNEQDDGSALPLGKAYYRYGAGLSALIALNELQGAQQFALSVDAFLDPKKPVPVYIQLLQGIAIPQKYSASVMNP